jgi:hypothetical protein
MGADVKLSDLFVHYEHFTLQACSPDGCSEKSTDNESKARNRPSKPGG